MSLSTQSSDATLNVPAQFANIINNPTTYPIFASQADDLQFVYNPGGTNTYSTYPFNPSNFGSIAGRFNMAATYVSALTTINDPRVFMTCDPAWALVTNVDSPAQYQFFVGASTGLDLGAMYSNASAGRLFLYRPLQVLFEFYGRSGCTRRIQRNVLQYRRRYRARLGHRAARQPGTRPASRPLWPFMASMSDQTNQTAYFLPPGANSVTQVAPYSYSFDWNTYYAQPAVQLVGHGGNRHQSDRSSEVYRLL